jgi:hypothetical protein
MHRQWWPLTLGAVLISVWVLVAAQSVAGTIEFTTTEVTEPTLTVSPDGRQLIFSLLGHLFRLSTEGTRAPMWAGMAGSSRQPSPRAHSGPSNLKHA